MPAPVLSLPSDADIAAIEDIERALVALHQAFARLTPDGWRAISGGFVPLSNEVLHLYFERLDSLQ